MHDYDGKEFKAISAYEGDAAEAVEESKELTDAIKEALGDNAKYLEKTAFSALKEEAFEAALKSTGKKHVIICGIEAHICVYQTAMYLVS